jgi:hypothetical protein
MTSYRVRAEDAEGRGDWVRAAMWWYYAAQEVIGNPRNLRTYFNQREDAAKAKARNEHQ